MNRPHDTPRTRVAGRRCATIAWSAALVLCTTAGCSHEPQAAAAAAAPVARPLAESTAAADPEAVPHGDHNPHHGGIVFMHGDTHFEVVLDRDGRHRVFFSDARRADLPASVAASLAIVVTRADGGGPESLQARIDDTGESWVADGRPVGAGDASARISFTSAAGPYFIDTPFMPVPGAR